MFKSEHRKIFRTRGSFNVWTSRAISNNLSMHLYQEKSEKSVNLIQEEAKNFPYQFSPCNFYKCRN